jgi:hypothetical protein
MAVGRSPLANAPPQRVPGAPPKHGRIPLSPPIDLTAAPTAARQTRAPRQRPVADVPNPHRPKVVRVVGGGELGDLFDVFPDLPRAPRPPSRIAARVISLRRRHL